MGSSTGYKEFIGAGTNAVLDGNIFKDKDSGSELTNKFSPLNDFGAGDIPM